MRLGIDFDNTLIRYDELFHKLALEKELIPNSVPVLKNAVRDYIHQQGREEEWTLMQGEVYGNHILEAVAWEGMQTTLLQLQGRGVELYLVSHKTRTPYLGPAYDLHTAAKSWLTQKGFFSQMGLNWQSDQVFFELTIEGKINRIQQLGCTYFLDDLPEILELLPSSVKGIHFCPEAKETKTSSQWMLLSQWSELPDLLS